MCAMKRGLYWAMEVLGWLLLLASLAVASVLEVGLDAALYLRLQKEAGVLETAGISEADLAQVDIWLADYLGGKSEELNGVVEVWGVRQRAFNQRELTHMADCRALFAPLVNPWLRVGAMAAGLALLGVALRGRRHLETGAAWLASALIVVPLGALGVWAALDFQAAFHFFHRMLFTNDLWLLDPATDLLIRICPSSMFAAMGLRIALYSAAALIGLPLALMLANQFRIRKRKRA